MVQENDPALTAFYKAVTAFEKRFRCTLTLHDYRGGRHAEILPHSHLSPHCRLEKMRNRISHPECIQFDRLQLPQELARLHRPLWKLCPGGMLECAFPLFGGDNGLIGCLFAGPFAAEESAPAPDLTAPPLKAARASCGSGLSTVAALNLTLPPLPVPPTGTEREEFLAYGALLGMTSVLLAARRSRFPKDMQELVRDFFAARHTESIGLADVAELLSLTPPRASEWLRRNFGKGFSDILKEVRLLTACGYLEGTAFPIEEVALRSGFRSGSYFHRIFLREFGRTPMAYRMRLLPQSPR